VVRLVLVQYLVQPLKLSGPGLMVGLYKLKFSS
jgi:hypothetical protein